MISVEYRHLRVYTAVIRVWSVTVGQAALIILEPVLNNAREFTCSICLVIHKAVETFSRLDGQTDG